MPEKADAVIIGGGVMGCAIAYNLAKEGLKSVVIEKSDIGGEASGSNGGGVRQSARNLKEMPWPWKASKSTAGSMKNWAWMWNTCGKAISGSALPRKSLKACDNPLK